MIELPDYVRDDINKRKYVKLDITEKIIGMWERVDDSRDHKEEIDGKVLPFYYGEWQAVPDDEIDRLNEERKKAKKIRTQPFVAPMTAREREIEAAYALLAKLRAQAEEED